MTWRSRALPLALLATAALVWWLALAGRRPPRAVPADSDAAQAAETLAMPARAASAGLSTPATRPAGSSRAGQATPPRQQDAGEEQAAPVPPDTRGFVDALEQRFAADPVDPTAGGDELWLRQVFAASGSPVGLLRSVACRRTVCKLDLRWTPRHDARYRAALDTLGLSTSKLVATRAGASDVSGAVPVTAFVARAARRAAAAR